MAGVYRICVKGRLDEKWRDWFGGFVLTDCDDGKTTLSGRVQDQAALHGLLTRIRDLGLPILSVVLVEVESDNRKDVRND
jgi:hypothetical protein